MRIRDPRTGATFDAPWKAAYAYCIDRFQECDECPIFAETGVELCDVWVANNLQKACDIMGFVLEEDDHA